MYLGSCYYPISKSVTMRQTAEECKSLVAHALLHLANPRLVERKVSVDHGEEHHASVEYNEK